MIFYVLFCIPCRRTLRVLNLFVQVKIKFFPYSVKQMKRIAIFLLVIYVGLLRVAYLVV